MVLSGQLHASVSLPHERNPVLIIQKAGWTSGMVRIDYNKENLLHRVGLEPRTLQPVVSRYTDLAILASVVYNRSTNF